MKKFKNYYKKFDKHFNGTLFVNTQYKENEYTNIKITCFNKNVLSFRWFLEVKGSFENLEDLLNEIKQEKYLNEGNTETF